jgi:hypothetical protein
MVINCYRYAEIPSIDYDKTYAPAMQKSTLLTLLAFAAANDYEITTWISSQHS